ncbi:1-pyrroline-5-carboxylate dehydrogenase [Paraburkholderia tagetis]|uniref:1-pyrroline-5-carboxylate dehydrogenase n=1 Tax=Paraburkholderia tagetis TaxID=2913261 RepID=A0A9X1UG90_9BURK|nr:1-pyrroline-5-carboxylate dehydrogenase [Paraburkholderia tagetis]MCG5072232.1 1-pyrroline-5-carboxylate dehydrogenase [Paraburkholderia tagetis]
MREDIVKYLGTVQQSTAKVIALKVGMDHLDVARELNHMLNDGLVEREKKHGAGNEYYYWLSRTERAPETQSQPVALEAKTDSAPATVIDPVEHKFMERQIAALQNHVDDLTARRDAAAAERLQIETERDELKVENDALKRAVAKLRENNSALERRIDELTIVDAEFKPNEVYVTVGRYAKPKRHKTIEKAQRRASQLVRSEKESEVLVCEPVGRVVRGSEWRPN